MREERLIAQARLAVQAQSYAAAMKDAGRLPHLADDADCPDVMRLAALVEEVGEVARALHDGDPAGLAAELSQVAGVALAWGVALEGVSGQQAPTCVGDAVTASVAHWIGSGTIAAGEHRA